MLEIRDLHVAYSGSRVLAGIDLRVFPGEAVALLGSNGAGKTTLLRTISGLLQPEKGEVLLDGERIDGCSCAHIVRRGLIHVPEGRQVFPDLTVHENLVVGALHRRKDKRGVQADRRKVLDLFPKLGDRLGQAAGTLSGGEQQMLAIARALMARPRILLFDEPSLGLSPLMVGEVFRVIRELNQTREIATLLVEQNANEALKSTQRAYVLSQGEIVRSGSSDDLRADPHLFENYVGKTDRSVEKAG